MARLPIKSLPLIGIVLFLATIVFFLIKSDREETEKIIPDEKVPKEDISTEKFKVYEPYTDKGITWTLESDEVHYLEKDEEKVLLVGFRFRYQQRDGFYLYLEGKNGEYSNAGNEIILSGEIKGEASNGYTFYTEHLIFQQKENCLKTDESVTLVGPFFKMTGKGLLIDLEKERLKMLKDIFSIFDKESLNK